MRHAPRTSPVRLPHRRPGLLLGVAIGGAAGTGCRAALSSAFPAAGGWPWATFAVNLSGAFALGLLVHALALLGPDDGRRRAARLVCGTGFLGGYTTYSTFMVESVHLAESDAWVGAASYDLASVIGGVLAAAAGMALAALASPPRGVS